ncbi:MAG: trigger factor [Desulfovibrio sp.]|uniref:trigger factor n=1 Tax=Desulfovibrio sp. 7SRBS1 TaxID=3378064 RepID=UPI003B3F70FB
MDYQVEELSPVERKVSVTVPAEEANAAILATTALYRRSAEIKGFRKGKVPANVVESRYRKQIYGEATQDLINLHLNQIMGEMKLSPMSGLQVDSEEIVKDQDFLYSFSFEVAPELELPNYKGISVEQEEVVSDEKEVQAVIDRVRERMAELVDVDEKRKPVDGEIAVVDFAALGDDQAFQGLRANNFQLELGSGQALEGFEEIVKGLETGDSGKGDLTFPEDFLNEDLAGKTVEVRVVLHSIKEKKLPELNDELATKAGGFESVEKMREAIEESYLASRRQLVKAEAEKNMLDSLIDQIEIPMPPSVLQRNLENIVADKKHRLEQVGKSFKAIGKTEEEIIEESREDAERASRSQLFLMAVATAEEMTVDPEQVDEEIRKMAVQSGQDFNSLKQYYDQAGVSLLIKDRILCDKAMEYIYSNAEIKEVPAKPKEEGAKEEGKEEA